VDYQWIRRTCLSLPGAFEDFPFGPDTSVFKVRGRADSPARVFALAWPDDAGGRINLKCDPALAEQLRAAHPEITPGYHMNKRHWNTVDCGGNLGRKTVRDLVEDSYDLVLEGMPRADREALGWRRLTRGD
jgi:predicted DNA-binding protein (MmcQ/YjbR family)